MSATRTGLVVLACWAASAALAALGLCALKWAGVWPLALTPWWVLVATPAVLLGAEVVGVFTDGWRAARRE